MSLAAGGRRGVDHTSRASTAAGHASSDGRRTTGAAPAADQRQETLRALAHPIRLQMLSLLTGKPLSAAELARALGITHANASYHLRLLARAGEVELAGIDEVRGGRARRYRYHADAPRHGTPPRRSPSTAPPAPADPPSDHLLVYAALAGELRRRAASAVRTRRQTLTDAELWVDDAAWTTFVDRLREASHDLHEAARSPRTAGTVRVSATIAAFQLADDTSSTQRQSGSRRQGNPQSSTQRQSSTQPPGGARPRKRR